jgi:glycolate oxidase iron-sulfur subunit
LAAGPEIYRLLTACLLCGACSENCPNGVAADDLIRQGRSLFIQKAGLEKWKKILAGHILPNSKAMKALSITQGLLFKKIPDDRGLKLRLLNNPRIWPGLAQPFFLERHRPSALQEGPARIGYFVGCSANYLYPEVAEATWDLLDPRGPVFLPADQTCCGLPSFSLGDRETARELARKNILAFAKAPVEAIVVSCSSCASHLKLVYPALFEKDPQFLPQVRSFSEKVEELSRFLLPFKPGLHQGRDPDPKAVRDPRRVIFHDPCHARRKLKITTEPRQILAEQPGLSLMESRTSSCCGHGGLFHLSHPHLSEKICETPLSDYLASGADVIATSCMACLMQFKERTLRAPGKPEVKHWAELIAAKEKRG